MNQQQITAKLNQAKIKLEVAIKLNVRKLMRKFVILVIELEAMLENLELCIRYTAFKFHTSVTIWCNVTLTKWGFSATKIQPSLIYESNDEARKQAKRLIKELIKKGNNIVHIADIHS